ncbi:MAG TPA: prolyl oligopeptidase family serine peptidase, partial [Candidatus Limnocylindria bacterium]|nr:prolyl oligopeptidase family serine peptidase [Candidatus Limnocylindria bacterium]
GLTELAAVSDVVVAYPNGTAANAVAGELAWNAGGCCGLASSGNVDDVGFVLAMIADLQQTYPIDASRIYLAGYSNGGMMSYRLACEHAELFAGIAVVSGALNYSPCEPSRPLSVLIVHGTGDLTVPYDGGETNARTAARFGQWFNTPVEFATAFWTENDDCDAQAQRTGSPPITTDVYPDCADGTRVEVVTIDRGTHTWPRTDSLGVDGAELVLDFFGLL